MATNREKVLACVDQSENYGILPIYDGKGETVEPGCSDVMRMYIKVEREVITGISYTITETACAPVQACASYATILAKGKPVLEAYTITKDQISEYFGGLDKEHIHCAIMAELTLKKTILDYVNKRNAKMSVANAQ